MSDKRKYIKEVLRKNIDKTKKNNEHQQTDDELFKEAYVNICKPDLGRQNFPIILKRPALEESDVLQQKLREEARAAFLQRRSRDDLLENDELKKLWTLLDSHSEPAQTECNSPGGGEPEKMLNYDEYKAVADKAGEKCRPYFTAKNYAKLQQNDPHGRVSVMAFFNYVMRKVWLHQTRIGLSLYDVSGHGFLREQDMENYIADLIPTLPQLDGLEKSFHNFYTCTAVRKFFFFLDPLRTGKIRIQDILACSFLDELLELRDHDLSKEVQEGNWFSAPSALRVYGMYLNLDQDHNGMLSKKELLKYGTGTMTPVFIERVFQECLTYDGEMDFKTYLDFVLACENRKEPQSLQYFFRVLDIKGNGFLDAFSLNFFFRDILREMTRLQQDPVNFADVKDEIFDMVRPRDPLKITLSDLVSCGSGDVVVSILIDLNGFWNYENRELVDSSS